MTVDDEKRSADGDAVDDRSPAQRAPFWRIMFLTWMYAIVRIAYGRSPRKLEEGDCFSLGIATDARHLSETWLTDLRRADAEAATYNAGLADGSIKPSWRQRVRSRILSAIGLRARDGRKTPGIMHLLLKTFGPRILGTCIAPLTLAMASNLAISLVLKYIINRCRAAYGSAHGQNVAGPPAYQLYAPAALISSTFAFQTVCLTWTIYECTRIGMVARTALFSLVFKRAEAINAGDRHRTYSDGTLLSLLSGDVERLTELVMDCDLLVTPIGSVLPIVPLLAAQLGYAAVPGIVLLAFAVPVQVFAARKSYQYRAASTAVTDKRMNLTHETLGHISQMKLEAWESAYVRRIHDLRTSELRHLRSLKFVTAATSAAFSSLPVLGSLATFATYAFTRPEDVARDPGTVFSTFMLFSLVWQPLSGMQRAVSGAVEGCHAARRLDKLFRIVDRADEISLDPSAKLAVDVREATLTWTPSEAALDDEKPFELELDLQIERGQLVAVVGAISVGKSALLAGLAGHLQIQSGSITVGGTLLETQQTPLIVSGASVQDQIIFGQPLDVARFDRVVRACCLDEDIKTFPQLEQTRVGERGLSLSGGQSARVCLARALYREPDILALDALDPTTGSAVFERALAPLARDGHGTAIVATNALHLLPRFDRILYLGERGRITEDGTYEALMAAAGPFARMMDEHSQASKTAVASSDDEVVEPAAKGVDAGSATAAEYEAEGTVPARLYLRMIQAAQAPFAFGGFVLGIVLQIALTVLVSFSLTWWQSGAFGELGTGVYMGIFAALSGALVVAQLSVELGLVFTTLAASTNIHTRALAAIARSPVAFFEVQPLGRILTRFSNDLYQLDKSLDSSLRRLIEQSSGIIAALVLVAWAIPYFLIPCAAASLPIYIVLVRYNPTMRAIRRLDALARSKLFATVTESLKSLHAFRQYGRIAELMRTIDEQIDASSRAHHLRFALVGWNAAVLGWCGAVLMLVGALIAVSQRYVIEPARIGLTLGALLTAFRGLQYIVRLVVEVDVAVDCVGRVLDYWDLTPEAPERTDFALPDSWPSHGALEFRNVSMRYRPDPSLPLVLRGVNFSIEAGQKVAIVGRTGAGKSSLVHALFRMTELASGQVVIDGIDVAKIGLDDLRRKLCVLPQTSMVLRGSIRDNLDPFGEHDDAALNDALRRSHFLVDPSQNLDTTIDTDGTNLSQAQRALLGLARALVRRSQIVVLDEASAHVDPASDAQLQATIAAEFASCTVISIAHRLRTILGFDQVIVMSDGRVAETGSPQALFARQGLFHASAIDEGEIEAARRRRKG